MARKKRILPSGLLLDTTAAAARLGVIERRVRRLIAEGQLKATMVGRQWVIKQADLERYDHQRKQRARKALEGLGKPGLPNLRQAARIMLGED